MKRNDVVRLLAIVAIVFAWFILSPAQAQDPYRVRGKLTAVTLPNFTVQAIDGQVLELTLSEESSTYVVTPGMLEDIDEGQFIGITSIDGADDCRVALEIHIFTEELRGVGEGH